MIALAVLGGGLGYLFTQRTAGTMEEFLLLYAVGFAWAAVALQVGDLASQLLDLLSNPLAGVDPTDPISVKTKLAAIRPRGESSGRVRRLLETWSLGWNPREVVGLADYQSSGARKSVYSGAAFVLLVLGLAVQQGYSSALMTGGLLLAALVLLARLGLLSRLDRYVEEEFLCRLPGNLPNTAITAGQLGEAVGLAIQQAFAQHVPQPEKTAAAIAGAVEGAGKALAAEAGAVQKAIASETAQIQQALAQLQSSISASLPAAGKALAEELAKAQSQMASSIAESGKTFSVQVAGVQGALINGLAESGMKTAEAIRTSQTELSTGLAATVKQVVEVLSSVQKSLEGSLSGAGREAAQQLSAGLSAYADRIEGATQAISAEIQQLGIAQKSIEKLLHVQEAADGTVKSLAAMGEFKETLGALRTHIQESDRLLREVAKPRTITLVEEDGEVRAV